MVLFGPDLEPDEQWKTILGMRIEEDLRSMAQGAKDSLAAELRRAPVGVEERGRLTKEYSDAMANIRKLAEENFQIELERERQERRWASGQAMLPQWSQVLKEEQQNIMDRIKSLNTGAERDRGPDRDRDRAPSPIHDIYERRLSDSGLDNELQKRHGDNERREQNRDPDWGWGRVPSPVHDIDERRVSGGPVFDNEYIDEPLLRPPERYRGSPDRLLVHERAVEAPAGRSMERRPQHVSDRFAVHLQPKPIPEVWKPMITPGDEAQISKPFSLGRRGSTFGIRNEGYQHFTDDLDHASRKPEPQSYTWKAALQISDSPGMYRRSSASRIEINRSESDHQKLPDTQPAWRLWKPGQNDRSRFDTVEIPRQEDKVESDIEGDIVIGTRAGVWASKKEARTFSKEEKTKEQEQVKKNKLDSQLNRPQIWRPSFPSSVWGLDGKKVFVAKASDVLRKAGRSVTSNSRRTEEQGQGSKTEGRDQPALGKTGKLEKAQEKDGEKEDSQDEKDEKHSALLKNTQRRRIVETEGVQDYIWTFPFIAKIRQIIRSKPHYRLFLSLRGFKGQQFLDLLQLIINLPNLEDQFRNEVLTAMQRLSKNSGLYPTCFHLNDSVQIDGEGPVAAGSFADIHKGYFLDQAVCLKSIRVYQKSKVNYIVKQVSREAILWGRLSHPNLIPFYGVYRDSHQRVCLVSPWIDNGHIKEYLVNHPSADRARLSLDVAEGIAYLHEMGIVHGDLKGPNILVGSSGRACLADFGLSSVIDHQIISWTSQSSPASAGGSVRWQAPETLAPEDTVEDTIVRNTKMSDVYAWGCVCYEIFTSRDPFFEEVRNATVTLKIMRGDTPTRPPPTSAPRRLWGLTLPIWNMMSECWSYDPTKRPGIDNIVTRLKRLLDISQDSRPPQTWSYVPSWHFCDAVNRLHEYPSMEDLDSILSVDGTV